jgi:hypothetical protein
MNIKASGRSALIITAGLWLCVAGPMRATESDARAPDGTTKADGTAGAPVALTKFTKPRAKKHAAAPSPKSTKAAAKTEDAKKPDDADAANDAAAAPMPPSVANANAQFPSGNTAADAALKVASAQADSALQSARQDDQTNATPANAELVSADQLNDVDRSLTEDKQPSATLALASMAQATARASDDSTWTQTSFIGKIFIAFGGLLTLASAARMFMA